MQALDPTWKLSGKYFLLKHKYPLLTPSRNIKACLEEWKCSTTFSYKLKISKLCWLRASVSETCLLCRQFLYLCCASTFQTSTANVLLRTIQQCCLGHLDDLIGLFFFLAICIKSMIHKLCQRELIVIAWYKKLPNYGQNSDCSAWNKMELCSDCWKHKMAEPVTPTRTAWTGIPVEIVAAKEL